MHMLSQFAKGMYLCWVASQVNKDYVQLRNTPFVKINGLKLLL